MEGCEYPKVDASGRLDLRLPIDKFLIHFVIFSLHFLPLRVCAFVIVIVAVVHVFDFLSDVKILAVPIFIGEIPVF